MDKRKCFVIMPITTPKDRIGEYHGGADHFKLVYKHLFMPAIEKAGLDPIPPKMGGGTEVIQAAIINKIGKADLVLCDPSTHNPNVFFELGIRTALNMPVCIVKDEKTTDIPFDIGDLNCHSYSSSLQVWEMDEIPNLSEHILKSTKEPGNQLWKYFGISAGTSTFPAASQNDKLDFIINSLNSIKTDIHFQSLQSHASEPYVSIERLLAGNQYRGLQNDKRPSAKMYKPEEPIK